MDKYGYEVAVCSARKHKRLFHYTTIGALTKIVGNKSLLLKCTNQLNDCVENEKIIKLWKGKVYVSCFTHREKESYFFWKTYAKGTADGVRISFNSADLMGMTIYADEKCEGNPLNDYAPKCSDEASSQDWCVYDKALVDIVYINRGEMVEPGDCFQARFKYSEWDDECETRLRVAIRPKGFELVMNGNDIEYKTPNYKYLYAKLPDGALNNMQITFSPFANQSLREEVENLLIQSGLNNIVITSDSVLCKEIMED